MKLLTWNTHNFSLGNREENLQAFQAFLEQEAPDVVALQEVCRGGGRSLPDFSHVGYEMLWIPVKRGYVIYDEGLAFLTREPPERWGQILLTPQRPYVDWRRRAALWIEWRGMRYVCLHMSWQGEGFEEQWARLWQELGPPHCTVLMGDLNTPLEELRDQMNDRALQDPCGGVAWHTVEPSADGWRGRTPSSYRIDGILCPKGLATATCRPVLYGLSDHRGVLVEIPESKKMKTKRRM